MTHTYNIRKTIHDPSTGLITKINFSMVTEEGGENYIQKYEFDLTGSPSDPGFIPFNDLTQANIEGFIDTYLGKSTIESSHSASLATHIESLVYSEDLPPNLQ